MRLADFIDANVETILLGVQETAATLLPAASHLDAHALRDHVPLILQAITADLRTAQSAEQEIIKSQGRAQAAAGARETAAQTHALLRAKDGFRISQVVAEYRALRASVLRLWLASQHTLDSDTVGDINRFNEAVDQAVAESVSYFSIEVERWRNVFLGILGHDLRGPLNAVLLSAQVLARLATAEPLSNHTARLIRSGERMAALLDDLLDYNRASLGLGISVERVPTDLEVACADELEILQAALPHRRIAYTGEGDLKGLFDASRMREALSNLVANAAKYGSIDSVIGVRLSGVAADTVTLAVENAGPPMAPSVMEGWFDPLHRGVDTPHTETSLGLGLFIVRQIARAHGGDVTAASGAGKIVFTMTLARAP